MGIYFLWVTFLAETSKDMEIILITIVPSFTNSLSRTSLSFSLKTSFVYSNLFSLAKTKLVLRLKERLVRESLFVKLGTIVMRIIYFLKEKIHSSLFLTLNLHTNTFLLD